MIGGRGRNAARVKIEDKTPERLEICGFESRPVATFSTEPTWINNIRFNTVMAAAPQPSDLGPLRERLLGKTVSVPENTYAGMVLSAAYAGTVVDIYRSTISSIPCVIVQHGGSFSEAAVTSVTIID